MPISETGRPSEPGAERRLARRLRTRRRWARSALTLEGLVDAFAPAAGVVALFLGLALLGLLPRLPGWLHATALVALAAALAVALAHGWRRFRRPTGAGVDRRLEAAAGLTHQPILAAEDRPSATEPAALRLWQAHLERERARLRQLPYVAPRPVLPRRDPWAVRAAAALVLVIAAVDAGPAWPDRLRTALVPQLLTPTVTIPARADLWVTPPLYTGVAPIVRTVALPAGEEVDTLVVPAGSELVLQLHDIGDGGSFGVAYALEPLSTTTLGPRSLEARTVLQASGALVVREGDADPLLGLAVEVLPDRPPSIAFVEPPGLSQRGATTVRFETTDDHGVALVELELALAGRDEATPERVTLRTFARPPLEHAGTEFVDLTPHPFAGQEVVARLVATDVAEQVGTSAAEVVVLPERVFNHPVARAIIGARKQLVAEPEERRTVAAQLNILAQSPEVAPLEAVVPLALRAASTRLILRRDGGGDRSTVDLLWDVAIYIEEGQFAVAERDLRALERALQEALERGADEAELEALMDALEAALEAFLEAMMQQAMDQLQTMQPGDVPLTPVDPNAQMLDRQDLQAMLDAMREAMQSGAMDRAQEMLAQLRQMLESLQMAMQMPMMGPMQQNLSALQEMIRRQQGLMDETFRLQDGQGSEQGQTGRQPGQQGQRGQQPGQQQGGAQGLQQQQEALRRALGELMRQLGESGQGIPGELGQAEMQMRGAEQALGEGQPGDATGPQGQALDLLQQGAGQLMEQLQQQLGQMPGDMGNQPGMGQQLQGTRDPLGRPVRNEGGATPYGVEVPDQPDLGTARDVLRELHRRSGERDRPPLELDYFDRLLRRF